MLYWLNTLIILIFANNFNQSKKNPNDFENMGYHLFKKRDLGMATISYNVINLATKS